MVAVNKMDKAGRQPRPGQAGAVASATSSPPTGAARTSSSGLRARAHRHRHPARDRAAGGRRRRRAARPTRTPTRRARSSSRASTRAAARSPRCWCSAARCTWATSIVAGDIYGRVRAMADYTGDDARRRPGPSVPVEVLGHRTASSDAGERFRVVENERDGAPAGRRAQPAPARRGAGQPPPGVARRPLRAHQGGRAQGAQHHHQGRRAGLGRRAGRRARARSSRPRCACRSSTPASARSTSPTSCWRRPRRRSSSASTCGRGREASALAEREGVDIRTYRVIYRAIEDVRDALVGLLEPGHRRGRHRPARGARHLPGEPHRHHRRLLRHRRASSAATRSMRLAPRGHRRPRGPHRLAQAVQRGHPRGRGRASSAAC